MSRFPKPIPKEDPAHLEFEAHLDLLVDDELPDDARTNLLRTLEQTPGHYRTLAHRFLERQSERKAVKQFISGSAPQSLSDLPANYPFHRSHSYWHIARNVAAVFVIAAVAAYGGIHYSAPQNSNTNLAGFGPSNSIPIDLPASVVGNNKVAVQVPVLSQGQVPINYPFNFSASKETGKKHIVMMPIGNNRAVIFPVTTDAAEIH